MRLRNKILTSALVAGTLTTAIALKPQSNVRVGPENIYPLVPGVVNPDITQANITQNICAGSAWSTSSIRPPTSYTNPIKVKDLALYNQKFGTTFRMVDGELDHALAITDAGNPTDPNNLYFEPYETQFNGMRMGAHEKDRLEVVINKKICSGEITLAQGQEMLTSDWVKYYLQFIGNTKTLGSTQDTPDTDDF